mgnify:CR=1 FL=1
MDARLVGFGVLEIDGQRYEHDVVIDHGRLLGAVNDTELDRAQDDLDEVQSLEPSESREVCRLLLRAYDKTRP